MKKLLGASLILSFFLISCGKDDDPSPASSDKYITTTNGSTWNYSYTDNMDASNNDTYVQTSSDRDTSAQGKSFHVFENSDGSHEYYNITGNDYYTLQPFSLGTDTSLVNLYLKDNAGVNTSWTQNYTLNIGADVEIVVTNKITAKDLTKTIAGTEYKNVIQVTTTITSPTISALPGSSFTNNIQYYYAPKVGMIENDTKIDLTVPAVGFDQHSDTKTQLTASHIL